VKCTERIGKPWFYPESLFKFSRLSRDIFRLKKSLFQLQKLDKMQCNEDGHEGLKFYHDYFSEIYGNQKSMEYLDSTIMFAGASNQTTADVISNTLLLLAMNPEKQDILVNELKSTLSSENDNVNEEQIAQMSYLDLVIKESLRMLPAVVVLGRKVTSDLKLTRFTAPAGSILVMPFLDVHLDKKLWGKDALEFKPERFAKENIAEIHPYAYYPFSKGQRMCPGYKYAILTVKIFLSRFLMKYRVSTSLMKYEDLVIKFELTIQFEKPPKIRIDLRSD
jgi:cytochrome P450 family 313